MSRTTLIALSCIATCLAVSASIGAPQVIFSNVSPSDKSFVPGGGGLQFTSFGRPICSPNGQFWMLPAYNNAPATLNGMYLTGSGTTGFLRVREGTTVIEGEDRKPENMNEPRVAINDLGQYAMTLDLTGDVTNDRVLVKGNGASLSIAYREHDVVGAALPGATYGTIMTDVNMNGAGQVSMRVGSLFGTLPNQMHALLRNDGAVLAAQDNNAAVRPTGQLGSEDWYTFTAGSYYIDADGNNWLTKGNLTGALNTSQVLAVNNDVKIQCGRPLDSLPGNVSNIIEQNMTSSGDWFARGENINGLGWVVRDGFVVAVSGDPVPGGFPGEVFSSPAWHTTNGNTFFTHVGNGIGDYIVAGFTDFSDTQRNAVWVLNGAEVIMRSGTQVDITGDGIVDDAYIAMKNLADPTLNGRADAAFLTNDHWFYFNADLVSAAGTDLGEAFLRVYVPEPATLALLGLGMLILVRRR